MPSTELQSYLKSTGGTRLLQEVRLLFIAFLQASQIDVCSDEGKMYATLATTKVQLQTGRVRFEVGVQLDYQSCLGLVLNDQSSIACMSQVLRSSPFLLSLGADSRSWASRLPFPL